ncbi:hypothetical protein [uncultured Mediterranean phage uvMED]|nr:hypothetical protein [uncultured Mediterranean phage uvMED]
MDSQIKFYLKLILMCFITTIVVSLVAYPLVDILQLPSWIKYVPGTIASVFVAYRFGKKKSK